MQGSPPIFDEPGRLSNHESRSPSCGPPLFVVPQVSVETYPHGHGWPKTSRVQIPRRAFDATSCAGAVLGSVFVADAGCNKLVRCRTSIMAQK